MANGKWRIIIAGSRGFSDYRALESHADRIIGEMGIDPADATVISGTAKGADTLGERYALSHGMELLRCPADWNKYGRAAGVIRNEQMAVMSVSDGYKGLLLAFWDGKSRGTHHMIDFAKKHGLTVRIVNI